LVNGTTESTPTENIILYSLGIPVALTSIAGCLAGLPGLIGFGNSVQGLTILRTTIDITGASNIVLNFAFSVPRDGVIKSIAGYFSNSVAINLLLSTVTIRAQLYRSTTASNTFSIVAGSQATLNPKLTGTVGWKRPLVE
jgi:BclB C-terminal domain-containing protein